MIHAHHRKRRSQGGDDTPINVIRIPDALHSWIHDNPAEAYDLGLLVKSHDDPSEVIIEIPEAFVQVKPKRKPQATTPEERRARVSTSIKTPKGEENVLPELIDSVREKIKDEMGWTDTVPDYFVLTAALARTLQEEMMGMTEQSAYGKATAAAGAAHAEGGEG